MSRPTLLRVAALLAMLPAALAASGPALGAGPVARLAGPARVEPRGQVLLDPAGSESESEPEVELARGPAPAAVVPLYGRDGRLAYAMASPSEPGTYVFVLIARGTPEGSAREARAYAFHEVVVGTPPPSPAPTPPSPGPNPSPNPGPGPAPTPDPSDLAAWASAEARKVAQPPAHRAAVASALARSYRAIAAQAAAGAFEGTEAMLAANRESIRACLGPNLDAWKPFLDALRARLESLGRAGALPDLPAHAEAWERIARGLEGVTP